MIVALLAGFIIGYILAIPPGPVGVTVMRLSLDKGIKHSVLAATGAGTMDFIYCLIIVFATSAMLSLASGFFNDYPVLLLGFQIFVVASVIIYGIVNIKLKDKIENPEKKRPPSKFKFLKKLSHRGPFFLGIGVAIANVANPTFLPSLAYITLNAHEFILADRSFLTNLTFAFAFGFGNSAWLYTVSKVLVHYKGQMSTKVLARIHQFAGYALVAFGAVLGYKVFASTNWNEILRYVFSFQ